MNNDKSREEARAMVATVKQIDAIASRNSKSSAKYLKAIDAILVKSNRERQRLYKRRMNEAGLKRVQFYLHGRHEGICRTVPGINNILTTFVKLLEKEGCPTELCDDLETVFRYFGYGR
jgi:hypothetical protein